MSKPSINDDRLALSCGYKNAFEFWAALSGQSTGTLSDHADYALNKLGYTGTINDKFNSMLHAMFGNIDNQTPMDCYKTLSGINLSGMTFYKDFTNTTTVNADYSVGSATGSYIADRDATKPATYIAADGTITLVTDANTRRYLYGEYTTAGFKAFSSAREIIETSKTNMVLDSYFASNSTTNWRAYNTSTKSTSTDYPNIYGAGQLCKFISAAQNDGVRTGTGNKPTFSKNVTYTVTAMVRGTGTAKLYYQVDTGAVQYGTVTTLISDKWIKLVYSFVADENNAGNVGVVADDNSTTCYIATVQCETGDETSFIPNTTVARTRQTEYYKYSISGNRSTSAETVIIKFRPFASWAVSGYGKHYLMDSDTKSRYLRQSINSLVCAYRPNSTDAVNVSCSSTVPIKAGSSYILSVSCDSSQTYQASIYTNDTLEGNSATNTWNGEMDWGNYFYIGCSNAATNGANGTIEKVVIFNRKLSDLEIKRCAGILGYTYPTISVLPLAYTLVDEDATDETIALYESLRSDEGNVVSFGNQIFSTTDYNQCYNITGKYGNVFGLDFIESYTSAPNFNTLKNLAKTHYEKGGIIQLSWHMNNWDTGGDFEDKTGDPVTSILSTGAKYATYTAELDKLATFLNGYEDSQGNLIPVILRMFHENDGTWFWWGIDNSTDAQFKQLWQETVTYLRDTKGVHNVLYCYAPEIMNGYTYDGALYPGDDYVDIFGIDRYEEAVGGTMSSALYYYRQAYDASITHNKVFAIAEGLHDLEDAPDSDFWNTRGLNQILNDGKASRAAYIMTWNDKWMAKTSRADKESFLSAIQHPKIKLRTP